MLLAEKKMEEIDGKMKGWDMLGHSQERAMLTAILWHLFTREEIILGVCEMSGNLSNKKVAAATAQPAQKQDKTWQKQGNVVHCGPAVFVCFENKHLAISITLMALSVTMDFAPCSNALRFTALCVHFVLFPMGFTSPCANQRKKNAWKTAICWDRVAYMIDQT